MSFDLYLFPARAGEEAADWVENVELEHDNADVDPAAQERNERLAAALLAAHTTYREHVSPKSRSLVGDDLEVYFGHSYACVTVEYEQATDRAALAARVHAAVRTIAAATGWIVYDDANQQVVGPLADAEDLRRAFDAALAREDARPTGPLGRLFRRSPR